MQYLLVLLFTLLSIPQSLDQNHQFHLSKAMVKYNEAETAVQISLHLFIDDLEYALKHQGADSLYIGTDKENEKSNLYIEKYLSERLNIFVDDKNLEFKFLGKELSEDLIAIWVYLEAYEVKEFKKVEIQNSILTEVFEDQRNIMNVTAYGIEEYLLLDIEVAKQKLSWK